jgi:hypothetical protein
MKITLTTWERVQLVLIISSGRAATIGQVGIGLRALAVLNLTDEEKAKAGWFIAGPNQFGWAREHDYELEFKDDEWRLVQESTRVFQAWPYDPRSETLHDKVLQEED